MIYLDGNSLGVLPKATPARVAEVVQRRMGPGPDPLAGTRAGWFDLPQRLGDKIARLVGARPGEVVATDSHLRQSLQGAQRGASHCRTTTRRTPGDRVSERSNFPTDLYIAAGAVPASAASSCSWSSAERRRGRTGRPKPRC